MNLEQRHEGSSFRHYLDDKPVHCGDQLRLLVSVTGKVWVWARYEATVRKEGISAVLYTNFGRVLPDEGTTLRWPTEGER